MSHCEDCKSSWWQCGGGKPRLPYEEVYSRPSLSGGLLFAVLTIRGLLIEDKIRYPRIFPRLSADFAFLMANMYNNVPKQKSLVIRGFGIREIF